MLNFIGYDVENLQHQNHSIYHVYDMKSIDLTNIIQFSVYIPTCVPGVDPISIYIVPTCVPGVDPDRGIP